MAPLDQSAGHALARAKRRVPGGHRNGPAAAGTHQVREAYTSLLPLGPLGAIEPQHKASPRWAPWWVGG